MCPSCKSDEVSRSKRRKFLDLLMWFLGMKAYRCRECNRRFYVPARVDRKLREQKKWLRDVQQDPKASRSSRSRKRKH